MAHSCGARHPVLLTLRPGGVQHHEWVIHTRRNQNLCFSIPRHGQRELAARRFVSDCLVVVNFKTYQTAHGASAEELALAMSGIDTDARMIAAVSALDLAAVVAAAPNLEVWCQHLDPVGFGSNTGWLHPETAIERGATGTPVSYTHLTLPTKA